MHGEGFSEQALQGCSRLAGLRTLVLHTHCGVAEGEDEEALAGLLSQAPHLTALRMAHSNLEQTAALGGELPPCLADYTGLRKLTLEDVGLPDLLLPPHAPLFQTVEELCLASNSLATLPAMLAPTSAPELRTLSVHHTDTLVIDGAAVDALLHLPKLTWLDLRRIGHMWPANLLRLARGAPQLELLVDSAADYASDDERPASVADDGEGDEGGDAA